MIEMTKEDFPHLRELPNDRIAYVGDLIGGRGRINVTYANDLLGVHAQATQSYVKRTSY